MRSMKYFLGVCFFLLTFLSSFGQDQEAVNFDTVSYYKTWDKISDLYAYEGLNRSAQKEVNALYEKIKNGNNPAQIYKSILYKQRFAALVSEDGTESLIPGMEKDLKASKFPVKALLSSVLADNYIKYYRRNRWTISRRKFVADSVSNYEQWSLKQFNERIIELLLQSVGDRRLKEVGLEDLGSTIQKGENNTSFEHSLYDVLSENALKHFENRNLFIQNVESFVEISSPDVFSFDSGKFSAALDAMEDKEQYPYWVLHLYNEVENYNRENGYSAALHRVQLKRLAFVKEHFNGTLKESRYYNALEQLGNMANSDESYGLIAYELGNYFWGKSEERFLAFNDDQNIEKELRKRRTEYVVKARSFWISGEKIFPKSEGGLLCHRMRLKSEQKGLSISVENRVIPNKPFLVQVNYRQLDTFSLYLHKFSLSEWSHYVGLSWNEREHHLDKRGPFKIQKVEVRNFDDFLDHSVEIMQEGLEEGYYILTPYSLGRHNSENSFIVSNLEITELKKSKPGSKKIIISNRTTGEPIEGVKLELRCYKNKKLENVLHYSTDENGDCLFELEEDKSYELHVAHEKDSLYIAKSWYTYKESGSTPKERFVDLLYTDRVIYRPGQSIYFKTLVLGKIGKRPAIIKSDTDIELSLYNPFGELIQAEWYKTNEYGSVSGRFILPKDAVKGGYSIRSSLGSGWKNIHVEDFKRPTFELTLNKPKDEFIIGDTVELLGKAITYSGAVLQGAELSYEVHYRYQPFFFWGSIGRNRYMPWSKEIFLESGKIEVDANGDFTIKIAGIEDLPAFIKTNHLLNFRVRIKATDISGESQELREDFILGEEGLRVYVEAYGILEGEDLIAQIAILNSNDQPIEKTIESNLYRLKEPEHNYVRKYWKNTDLPLITKENYSRYFPDFSYEPEKDKSDWERGKLLKSKKYKGFKVGQVNFRTKKYRPGVYLIEIKTEDKTGREVRSSKVFTIYGRASNKDVLVDQIIILSDKEVYDIGEKAKLDILFPNRKGFYRIMIHYGDSIIWEGISSGKKTWHRELEIKEAYIGNIFIEVHSVYKNRLYTADKTIGIPWSNKNLNIEWLSFRDKLKPGEKEKWILKFSGQYDKPVKAEIALSLYDTSLDSFWKHRWYRYHYPMNDHKMSWSSFGYSTVRNSAYYPFPKLEEKNFTFSRLMNFKLHQLDYFTLTEDKPLIHKDNTPGKSVTRDEFVDVPIRSMQSIAGSTNGISEDDVEIVDLEDEEEGQDEITAKDVQIRENFAETVFFYPQLETDSLGNVEVEFTMTDAVTRYRLLGYAHTKELEQVLFEKELVVQKELMVQLYAPRFLREGDSLSLRSKVMNISNKGQLVTLKLEFYNALTEEPVDWTNFEEKEVEIKAKSSISESWDLIIPKSIKYPITYKVIAVGALHSDAEQNTLPVLSNRSLIKESLAISLRPNETKEVLFQSLDENSSTSLEHHVYRIESTANPLWYAIQALPYLSEVKHESSDRLMSKYFANQVAGKIIADNPEIQKVFKLWQNDPEAMKSPLQKNGELKEILLSQTPWLAEGQSEAVQLKNIALLFDINRSAEEARMTLTKLRRMQLASGAFPWFSGGRGSRYTTQSIVASFAKLKSLGIDSYNYEDILKKALRYMDTQLVADYARLKEHETLDKMELPGSTQLHYLYVRSSYLDFEVENKEFQQAYHYYLNKAEKHWTLANIYGKGLIAFSAWKNDHVVAKKILNSLKELAVQSDEMGMYWTKNVNGYYWNQRKIETQSLMISLYQDIMKDKQAVRELQIWLLQQKRTSHWGNSKSTVLAIYALLSGEGSNALSGKPVEVSIAGDTLSSGESLLGLGTTKNVFEASKISQSLAKVKFENRNDHLAFGSLYWQYFEDLDKVNQFSEGPLKLNKKLFVLNRSNNEWYPVSTEHPVEVGDMVLVRIEIEVDRDLEYVHLKDGRSSGLEPLGLKSGYQWNGELGHYRSVGDANVNFFFDNIRKGKHVLEYRLVASHGGNFSNGISRIQCMYAPEFSSHSKGIRLSIEP